MPVRKANAEWRGDLREGNGKISSESGVLNNISYNFVSRFEQGDETNPEELIGAAHAACYSMALANGLSNANFKVNSIKTEDKVHIEKLEAGFTITKIEISTVVDVEGIDEATFQKHAEDTKKTCPVSKALTGTEMFLTATLKK
ncbi:MAG TPA: OsmC family peroxiredoxin [Ignavibacteria bacterium]|nr:OsmC family peroxiredoxin [Ignavibacteria bacterium]